MAETGQHLRALKERYAPGRSVASLEEASPFPVGRLSSCFRDSQPLKKLPSASRLVDIATIIGGECTASEVAEAIFRDVYPEIFELISLELPADERELLEVYRRIAVADRPRARAALALTEAEHELLETYRSLDEAGQQRAVELIALDANDRELLDAYRRVAKAHRRRAVAMIEILGESSS